MPRLISALIGVIVGYLDGAGLGAAFYDLSATGGAETELRALLVAAALTGPLGALLGLLFTLHRQSEQMALALSPETPR